MKYVNLCTMMLLGCLTTPALAQTPTAHHDAPAPTSGQAEKAFDTLKSLEGSWVGRLTTTPKDPQVEGALVQFSLRVGSRGHALIHELSVSGLPDHPITMFYVEGQRLELTHYCDAGNRPRMSGTLSPDGKTLEFDFVDLSGGNEHGHMHHAVITLIDEHHHVEDWTYMMPGNVPVRAHFDLQRTNFQPASTH